MSHRPHRRSRPRIAAALGLALLLVVCVAPSARADVIHLRDGRKLEGTVVKEDDTSVTVKLKFGEQVVPRTDIVKIEKKQTVEVEFKERFKALKANDADGFYDLGQWAQARGMAKEARQCFERAIQIDTDHQKARNELGFHRYENRWYSAEKVAELKAAAEEEANRRRGMVEVDGEWITETEVHARKMGLVEHQGKWITPYEKELLDQGFVKYKGRWMSEDERNMIVNGFQLFQGKWVKQKEIESKRTEWAYAWEVGSLHYTIRTNISQEFGDEMASLMEQAYEAYRAHFGADLRDPSKKLRIFVFSDKQDYRDYCNNNRFERFVEQDGFFHAEPNLMITWSGHNLSFIRTFLVGTGVWQYYYNAFGNGLPSWLSEGYAAYFGACLWDGTSLRVGLPHSPRLKRFRQALDEGGFIRLDDLITADLAVVIEEGYFHKFSAASWAFTYFLVNSDSPTYRQQFQAFQDDIKVAPFVMGNTDILGRDLFLKHFGRESLDRLERDWMDYMDTLAQMDAQKPALPDELKKMEEEAAEASGSGR